MSSLRLAWVVVVTGMLTAVTPARAGAQISPGPLARPHAALEGTGKCLSCHPVGNKALMDGACLACHREIAWLKQEHRGLHDREARGRCASCHPDHAGADFNLIGWTRDSLARFEHRRAGWALEGKHADAKCDACHTQKFRVGQAAKRTPPGSKPTWWIGLETTCTSCHEDIHRGSIRSGCTACHTAKAWVPTAGFDHDSASYVLTGRHRQVECVKCHQATAPIPQGRKSLLNVVFTPRNTAECSACHKDAHDGRLGARCSDCHVTTGFRDRVAGRFDHSKTRYLLEGRHATVKCAACHGADGKRTRPAFARCSDCHKDAHEKQATSAPAVRDCAACHTPQGFKPSSFTSERHTQGTCTDCHVQAHGSQLAAVTGASTCGACHSVVSWKSSTWPTSRHASFQFPLDGRHAEVACGACHAATRPGLPPLTVTPTQGTARVVFKIGSGACVACHVDPHDRQYATCTDCHGTLAFRPSTMNFAGHARAGFALEGAHQAVPCAACHEGLSRRPAGSAALLLGIPRVAPLALRTTRTTCAACHADPHAGQFGAAKAGRCETCHDQEAFVPAARFNHDRDAAFRLEGAHARVPCARCHPAATGTDGRSHLTFRPVPSTCESCHPVKPARTAGGH